MFKSQFVAWAVVPVLAVFVSCNRPKTLDESRLRNSDQDTGNWLMYGRTYDDHRFSPLNEINEQTVGKLGLTWSRETRRAVLDGLTAWRCPGRPRRVHRNLVLDIRLNGKRHRSTRFPHRHVLRPHARHEPVSRLPVGQEHIDGPAEFARGVVAVTQFDAR